MKFALGFVLTVAACGGDIRIGSGSTDAAPPTSVNAALPIEGNWQSWNAPNDVVFESNAVVIGNRIYIVGDVSFPSSLNLQMLALPIAADGTLGTLQTFPASMALQLTTLVAVGNHLYFLGGVPTNEVTPSSSQTFLGSQQADGSLTYSETTPLPTLVPASPYENGADWTGLSAFAYNNSIYAFAPSTTEFYRADIASDFSIGAWTKVGLFPNAPVSPNWYAFQFAIQNNYLYVTCVIASIDSAGVEIGKNGLTGVFVAKIADNKTIGTFSPVTSLPAYRPGVSLFTYGGDLYAFGGGGGFEFTIDPSDWKQSFNYSQPPWSQFQSAPFNADGSIGAWQDTGTLPTDPISNSIQRSSATALVANGNLYIVGGTSTVSSDGYILSDVLFHAMPTPPPVQ